MWKRATATLKSSLSLHITNEGSKYNAFHCHRFISGSPLHFQ
ncbi:hypothetical protein L195_g059290, partial [Trifolium pratense]